MSLSKNSLNYLRKEFESIRSFHKLFFSLVANNNFTIFKLIRLVIYLIFSIFVSYFMCIGNEFKPLFDTITNAGIALTSGMFGLIVAGLSIILSIFNNDLTYCLMLQCEKTRKRRKRKYNVKPFYKSIILNCIEPLMWFLILLIVCYTFKLLYLLPSFFQLTQKLILILKTTIITTVLFFSLLSINSLVIFIINLYNLLCSRGNFIILEKYSKSQQASLDLIIKNLEVELNKEIEEEND